MTDFDLLIVGGGLNGPVLALAASRAGFTVGLIDPEAQATQKSGEGRAYAISKGSQRLLRAVGIWDALGGFQPMLEVKVSDADHLAKRSPQVMQFDADEIEESPMGFMIEDHALREAMAGLLGEAKGVQCISGTAAGQTCEGAQAQVSLADGRKFSARLIAGCDGRASPTAERAGLARVKMGYGQMAVVCTLNHSRPHGGVAHQMFLPDGPLAILPLTGDRCAIVWSTSVERARLLTQGSDADFMAALTPLIGDFLGDISLAGDKFAYPLSLSVTHSFIAERLCLVGDAAHGMHPVAGQGLNAGIRDIAALIEVLSQAKSLGEDIGSTVVLRRYDKWRRPEVMRLVVATDIITRSFSNDNALLRPLRDMALGAISALPAARRQLIREAAGLGGHLPELMQP